MQYIPRNMYDSRFVMLVWHAHLPGLLQWHRGDCPGIILCMGSANERCHYVTPSLIGWAQAQNDPGCPSGSEETMRRMRVHGYSHNNTQHNITVAYMYFTGCILPGRCTHHWLPLMKPNGLTTQKAGNTLFFFFFFFFSSSPITINLATQYIGRSHKINFTHNSIFTPMTNCCKVFVCTILNLFVSLWTNYALRILYDLYVVLHPVEKA